MPKIRVLSDLHNEFLPIDLQYAGEDILVAAGDIDVGRSGYLWLLASHHDKMVENSGASLWIHGHTHASCDYLIGKTRVLCNPRGYAPDDLNPCFDPYLIVTIDAPDSSRAG